MTRRAAALLLALALLLAALPAAALAAEPRVSFNDIEDEVMCDTCNVPLNIAESPRADQQRAQIRRMIDRGMTKEEIKAELVRIYGPAILAEPPREGFGLAAYLVPVGAVVAVGALLAALVPRWRRRESAAAPDRPTLSAEDARRLDEDLARYDL